MEIRLKEKEKQFYYSILNDFYSKINIEREFSVKSIVFSNFLNENFKIYHGVTKVVIVPKNRGARYVLKIPIGEYDYCEVEVKNYRRAEEEGLSNLFTSIDVFDSDNYSFPVYIQEKVRARNEDPDGDYDGDCDCWESLSEESTDSIQNLDMSGVLVDELIYSYGVILTEMFISFCEREIINDVHGGNYGYRRDGSPVVYDYSGIGLEVKRKFLEERD